MALEAQKFAILIGPDGRWFHKHSPEFFAHLGDYNPDYDSILFAVRNLGYVEFVRYNSSLVEITLHPLNVENSTLQSVQNYISLSQAKLFMIRHLDCVWKSEIANSARDAIVKIFQLCADSGDRPAFRSTELVAICSERREAENAIGDWEESGCRGGDPTGLPSELPLRIERDKAGLNMSGKYLPVGSLQRDRFGLRRVILDRRECTKRRIATASYVGIDRREGVERRQIEDRRVTRDRRG